MIVVFDNDDDGVDSKGNSNAKRKSNINLAKCFGLSLEQILHTKTWDKTESKREPKTILVILSKDFETAVKKDYESRIVGYNYLSFDDMEKEAVDLIKPVSRNQAKGLIARYIARRIHTFMPEYAPEFVHYIAGIINEQLKLQYT